VPLCLSLFDHDSKDSGRLEQEKCTKSHLCRQMQMQYDILHRKLVPYQLQVWKTHKWDTQHPKSNSRLFFSSLRNHICNYLYQ